MAAISKILRSGVSENGDRHLFFHCPGCDFEHTVKVVGVGSWGWNGNADKPTFTPSILLSTIKMTDKGNADIEAWRAAGCPKRGEPFEHVPHVCHSFVTDGQIQFLSDCTHHLAGQTVPLPDFDQALE